MLTVAPERATAVRRRRHGSSFTRRRILTASMYLFSTKGFTSTTVRDIARQAGITDAAIYYHFATKEDLLHELVNTRLKPHNLSAKEMRGGPAREATRALMLSAVRIIEANHELLRIILREGLAGDPVAARRYGQLLDDWESRLSGRLRPFESAGALTAGEATTVARQIMYTIIMAFEDMVLLRPDASVPPAERRLQTMAFLSRHITWLLPPTCNSPTPPGTAHPAINGSRRAF